MRPLHDGNKRTESGLSQSRHKNIDQAVIPTCPESDSILKYTQKVQQIQYIDNNFTIFGSGGVNVYVDANGVTGGGSIIKLFV